MVILDLIPLIPLPRNQPQIVSYYPPEVSPRGTVVRVLFNNRKIKAVVIGSASLAERKLQFKKQAGFTLKKIEKILKDRVTDAQIKKARELSEYYFVSLGLCLRAVMLHPDAENYKRYISPGPVLDLPELISPFPPYRKGGVGGIQIVDMRREIRDANYSIFSRDLKEALQTFDRLIIFIPRLGYNNLIICEDCGNTIKCPNCSVSLIPSLRGLTPQLVCHHCNNQEPAPKNCPACKSYNLKPRGVGIEKVEAELIKFFKYQNLKVPKIKKLSGGSKMPGDWDILLATQSIFKYYALSPMHCPFLAIINADALIHIPDFRAEEMLLRQTLALASMADETLIQTYNPDDPALVAATTGKVKEFWEQELVHRKAFGYPPFSRLVKLTIHDREAQSAKRKAQSMAEKLGGSAYPALIFRERGQYIWNVLIKIKDQNSNIKSMLHQLPPDWQIDVDP